MFNIRLTVLLHFDRYVRIMLNIHTVALLSLSVMFSLSANAQQIDSEGKFNFSSNPSLNVKNQNRATEGSYSVSQDGESITFTGNWWSRFLLETPYEITANTILEVTINANPVGEVVGVVLHNNIVSTSNPECAITFGGSQEWQNSVSESYTEDDYGNDVTFRINLGDFHIGEVQYLTVMSDDDVASSNASVTYSNLKIYEEEVYDEFGSLRLSNKLIIGNNTQSTGRYALAVGESSTVNADNSVAIGFNAQTNTDNSLAVGDNAVTRGNTKLAVSGDASVSGAITASHIAAESIDTTMLSVDESLQVGGSITLDGEVIISNAQGDISMGAFGE